MNKIIEVTAYGAIGDGITDNTRALQQAIDACEAKDTVKIPAGCFVSGAIFLKSDMTLELAEGATLLGSSDLQKYPVMRYRFEGWETECYASLINTKEGSQSNIAIVGKGTINASGRELFHKEMAENKGKRGRAVCLRNTKGIQIKDVTIRQSPAWCLHLIYCEDILIEGVSVHTKYDEEGKLYADIFNGDGIDIDSCKNVVIKDSLIASQDDCIAIKSGKDEEGRRVGIPTENVEITNCTLKYGFGVAMGSEMSGGIRKVSVRDCCFEDTYSFASIKAPRGRGGIVEDIHYANITHYNHSKEHQDCKWFRGSLYVDMFYSVEEYDAAKAEPVNEGTPIFRNLTFENITTETIAGNGIYLCGLPESPIENITLRNVQATAQNGILVHNVHNLDCEGLIQHRL